MSRTLAILGTLAAIGAAYASKDVPDPAANRIRGRFRAGQHMSPEAAVAAIADALAKSGTNVGPPDMGSPPKPGDPKTTPPAKPADPPKKADPPKPVAKPREIKDMPLLQHPQAQDFTFSEYIELRITPDADGESELAWFGGGKSARVATYGWLTKEFQKRTTQPVILVAVPATPWSQVRFVLQTAQDAGLSKVHLGAARPDDPTGLRGISVPVPFTKGAPMPAAAECFVVRVNGDEKGVKDVVAAGKPLAGKDLASEIAAAWKAWSAANAKGADTSAPEKTRVVLDADGTLPTSAIVPVIAAMRAAGISSERHAGRCPQRPN